MYIETLIIQKQTKYKKRLYNNIKQIQLAMELKQLLK